jgi:hypothetical protein
MRYLLLGNAPDANLSEASLADVIVQINTCPHADKLPPDRTRFVFILNTDPELSTRVIDHLSLCRDLLPNATIILARNPVFYTLKKWAMRARNHWHWRENRLSPAWKRLKGIWPIKTISLLATVQLEMEMLSLGMPHSFHPSTGLIAYKWILRRMTAGDVLDVAGFTHQGWDRHSWAIEKQIISAPIYGTNRRNPPLELLAMVLIAAFVLMAQYVIFHLLTRLLNIPLPQLGNG